MSPPCFAGYFDWLSYPKLVTRSEMARLALLAVLAFVLIGSALARPVPSDGLGEAWRQGTEAFVRSGVTVTTKFLDSDLFNAVEAWMDAWR